MVSQHMYEGWSFERFRRQRNRAHFLLEDPYRFVTVLLHDSELYAIDSPCYHASGPLGEGELVDIEDTHTASSVTCLRCPWHNILVAIDTGEVVEVEPLAPATNCRNVADNSAGDERESEFEMPQYPLRAHWMAGNLPVRVRRGNVVQRTHKVWLDESTGVMTIEVEDRTEIMRRPVSSDAVAGNLKNGALTMQIFDIKSKGLS